MRKKRTRKREKNRPHRIWHNRKYRLLEVFCTVEQKGQPRKLSVKNTRQKPKITMKNRDTHSKIAYLHNSPVALCYAQLVEQVTVYCSGPSSLFFPCKGRAGGSQKISNCCCSCSCSGCCSGADAGGCWCAVPVSSVVKESRASPVCTHRNGRTGLSRW